MIKLIALRKHKLPPQKLYLKSSFSSYFFADRSHSLIKLPKENFTWNKTEKWLLIFFHMVRYYREKILKVGLCRISGTIFFSPLDIWIQIVHIDSSHFMEESFFFNFVPPFCTGMPIVSKN